MEVVVDNISKRYGKVEALRGVSFAVKPGELFGLIGPDGAGKSTLFRILTTLLLADEGTATVGGADVVKDYKEIRRKVGYMPGRFSLYQDLTVEENLNFFATVFHTTIEENYDLVKDIYQQIEPFKKRRAGALSGGMKQKLALSCALIHKPDILFLDIQMPGMDGMETAKMLRQDNENMILIFVTAAEEYVFQAFDVGAFHYLVKPFSDEKLKEVVTKAVHNIKRSSRLEKDEKYIMVQTAGSHIKIFLRDIVYAEVYNRKVIIHTRSTDIEYYGKLQELSDMAGTDFFRTHRAYLVHFKYVEKYDATCVTMKNGTALIAKKNYPEFVRRYLKYNQRKGNEVR